MNNQNKLLPWDEIFDRLYYRQDPLTIVDDLVKRGKIQEGEIPSTLSLVESLRQKMELFRLEK
jgi:hypothetical protein